MKKSLIMAAAFSLALAGCAAKQGIDPTRMQQRPISRADSLYVLSEEAAEEGNYNLAEGYLEEILSKDKRSQKNQILLNYGMARIHLEKSHNFEDRSRNRNLALGYFEKVLELTDDDARFNSYRIKSEAWVKYLGNR